MIHNHLHPGESVSLWQDSESMTKFTNLRRNLLIDVCVVGGGIAGLTTAYHLLKEGKTVCVLEDFEIGSGQTGKTTAHFSPVLDMHYIELEKYHGSNGARKIADSHTAAIQRVEQIIKTEKIECEMKKLNGYLFAELMSDIKTLREEYKAAHKAGLIGVEYVEQSPIRHFANEAIRFPNQLQLHPLMYINGLADAILKMGGQIFTNTHVSSIEGGNPAIVKTKDGHEVRAMSVVVATNTPINNLFAIHTKQAPYRTYVLGFSIPKGSFPDGLYWDMMSPYHYVRVEPDPKDENGDILIVGGEDHKTGQDHHPQIRFTFLEEWTRSKFPFVKEIAYRWSGQVMQSIDGLAYLGHNPADRNNVYVITGDTGNGMTNATIGAMLVTDQIMERKNQWEDVYNPSRLSLRALADFVKENSNVAIQYTDWFSAKPTPNIKNLPYEEGVVFRSGIKMIAAYKDETGHIELMSAACPHLGGVVSWNHVEKSWDCPCHGSRFDCHGKVLEGPATTDLEKIHLTEPKKTDPDIPERYLVPFGNC